MPLDMHQNLTRFFLRALCVNPVLMSIVFLLALSSAHGQMPSPDKVRQDFKDLLQRPSTSLRPSFESIKTDSVLIEKGFFYSEATEKVPVLIYKPLAAGQKNYPWSFVSTEPEEVKRSCKGFCIACPKLGLWRWPWTVAT